jgi:hypothetical protein
VSEIGFFQKVRLFFERYEVPAGAVGFQNQYSLTFQANSDTGPRGWKTFRALPSLILPFLVFSAEIRKILSPAERGAEEASLETPAARIS